MLLMWSTTGVQLDGSIGWRLLSAQHIGQNVVRNESFALSQLDMRFSPTNLYIQCTYCVYKDVEVYRYSSSPNLIEGVIIIAHEGSSSRPERTVNRGWSGDYP